MIISERVRERMEQLGLTQSELARRVKITQGAVAKIVSKNPGGSSHLHKIAQELGTTPDYLTGGTDDPALGALPAVDPERVARELNSVLVRYYPDPYSLGGGSFLQLHGGYEEIPFSKDWLRSRRQGAFNQLMLLPGRGTSMRPTINDGDVLLIDKAQTTVEEPDLIWAFNYGEVGMIKRLRRQPRGGWFVSSDNHVVHPFEAADDEIHIVGRVISIMQWQ